MGPGVEPAAVVRGAAETKTTYQLLSHKTVGWRDILAPHGASSLRLMSAEPVVLCLQDTTEIDFNGQITEGSNGGVQPPRVDAGVTPQVVPGGAPLAAP